MQIFLLSKAGKKTFSFPLNLKTFALATGLVVGAFIGTGFYLGHSTSEQLPVEEIQYMQNVLEQQKQVLADVQLRSENTLDGLALRIGQLQSQMLRLNAVGQNLAKRAKLDPAEFNFDEQPALGGAQLDDQTEAVNEDQLLAEIAQLQEYMALREQQLKMLDNILIHKNVNQESKPAGRPIEKGWLSSHYGRRTDPFTGRRAYHHGIDFAGKEGSPVVSVASGLVTWVGDRDGYGKLVEIDHGNGYVTRYGHNAEILVNQGDVVQPSQVIAKMGSTGRSTGPHVHFEVLQNGKTVDPVSYIRKARHPIL